MMPQTTSDTTSTTDAPHAKISFGSIAHALRPHSVKKYFGSLCRRLRNVNASPSDERLVTDGGVTVDTLASDDAADRLLASIRVDTDAGPILATVCAPTNVDRETLADALAQVPGPLVEYGRRCAGDLDGVDDRVRTDGGLERALDGETPPTRMRGGWLRVVCQDCDVDRQWWREPGVEQHPHDHDTDHEVAYEAADEAARNGGGEA